MTNEPARFAWEEDTDMVDEFLWEHGYARVRGFEGVWRHGPDGPPSPRLREVGKP